MAGARDLPASEAVLMSITVGSAGGDVRTHVALREDLDDRNARRCRDEPRVPGRQVLLALVDRHLPGRTSAVKVAVVERLAVESDHTLAEETRIQACVARSLRLTSHVETLRRFAQEWCCGCGCLQEHADLAEHVP